MKLAPVEITKLLIANTISKSNFQTKRDYVSMSSASKSPEQIYQDYINGYSASTLEELKCYKGYQMERDLLSRIVATFNTEDITHPEITAFGGIVKGHPDFKLYGCPAECKSVLMDEWLPQDNKVSNKIYWQMQAYMLYSKKKEAFVVFESRENGQIRTVHLKANERIMEQIEIKFKKVVEQINFLI